MIHASPDAHLNVISDPRKNNWLKRYELRDILIVAVCATIGGADGFTEISDFGKQHIDWFRKFLILPHGIPSHDTFNRVFSLLDPAEFNRCFVEWMGSACDMAKGEIVPIDGKTIKGSKSSTESALHIVSAWSSKNKLVLGQLATDKKSNEITAIPKLLDMLEISNCIVTTDAMGCQKAIAKKIVGKNANYVLGLKGNQGKLHKEIVQEFGDQTIDSLTQNTDDYFESVDGDHGRIETRRFWTTGRVEEFSNTEKWVGLKTIGIVESVREIAEKVSRERRYFLCSIESNAKILASAVRDHWGIENSLHWSLDTTFNEDACQVKGNAAQGLSGLRHIAINLIKKEPTKAGIQRKRKCAGWNTKFLEKILVNQIL